MRRFWWIILFLLFVRNASLQTIDQKLAVVQNPKSVGSEFIISYMIKGTDLTSSNTLASLNVDIVYDTTNLRFAGGTDWQPAISDSNGYIKSIRSNPVETGTYKSLRIDITAPYLNDSVYSSGFGLTVEYSTIVLIHFIILSDTGYTSISLKSNTNQVGLFFNPHNQPNTFEIMSMILTDPVIINEPLPVELVSFTSDVNKNDIKLNWKTGNEINNQGFEIQRQKEVSGSNFTDWEKIGFVKGHGTISSPGNFSFEDKKLNSGKYKYRLKQIDYSGNFTYHNLEGIISVGIPGRFNLSQNYPNPFNPATKIDFEIPTDSKVKIIIYDITGRELQTILKGEYPAGYYTAKFSGENLSSGIYFYRIIGESEKEKFIETKKMILTK